MIVLKLAVASLLNRWLTGLLTVLAIAVSVMLLVGVDKVRKGARDSFAGTIAGTDLIVGARSGPLQLLLYSVFRIGNATNNITWATYRDIAQHPDVEWSVPLSLGDSHRGYRVLGTTGDYFTRYRYRGGQPLVLSPGAVFSDLFDVVLGADVAANLGYRLGDSIVIGHGLGSVSFLEHGDKPFRVAGILAKTGTPVDRTLHVSLEAIEAIHVDWQQGAPVPGQTISAEAVRSLDLTPKEITAALVGLKSKLAIFRVQRDIAAYPDEPVSAILPGAALQELWSLVGLAETALAIVAGMVVATALIGMVTMILTTLNERRREMAILRSVGARPSTILGLMTAEAGLLTTAGVGLGAVLVYGALALLRPVIDAMYGLYLPLAPPDGTELATLAAIVVAGCAAGLVPAVIAYRRSLADGMSVRL
ncbi:MAG: ABC transporter permease [Hyphomicrobiaceae bacterium]|nr:ABC transporter permease [Hyphomicrobiaceae bacterium]